MGYIQSAMDWYFADKAEMLVGTQALDEAIENMRKISDPEKQRDVAHRTLKDYAIDILAGSEYGLELIEDREEYEHKRALVGPFNGSRFLLYGNKREGVLDGLDSVIAVLIPRNNALLRFNRELNTNQ